MDTSSSLSSSPPPSPSSDSAEYYSSEYEDEQPKIKRQKLSLPPRTQICIVTRFSTRTSKGYDIIVADIDSLRHAASFSDQSNFFPMRPTLRLKIPRNSADFCLSFCGLGSMLYIFESTPKKSVYTIDLLPYSSSDLPAPTLAFRKKELTKAPDMCHPKHIPLSIPTPDGKKILVFSFLIKSRHSDSRNETIGDHDFELYDPETNTWQKLPGIAYGYASQLMVRAYTFIGTSTFFLETDDRLMFTLDLDSLDKGWRMTGTFFGTDMFPHFPGQFLVIEEQLCVAPRMAFDVEKKTRERYCCFSFDNDDLEDLGAARDFVAVLGSDDNNNNGIYNFCTLAAGERGRSGYPHLVMILDGCNLSKYKQDKEERGDIAHLSQSMTVGESFNFYVECKKERTLFTPCCLFSFCA